jgi:hypothetical protein
MVKLRFAIFILVMLALALAACGGDDGGEDVTKPVNDFFKAFGEMDAEKAAQAVCEQHRGDVKTGLDMIFGFMAMGGEDAKIEVVDLNLEVQDQTDDEAMVVATSGKIRITVLGEVQEEAISDDSAESTEAIKVIKEDGKWVVCDDSLVEGFGP